MALGTYTYDYDYGILLYATLTFFGPYRIYVPTYIHMHVHTYVHIRTYTYVHTQD